MDMPVEVMAGYASDPYYDRAVYIISAIKHQFENRRGHELFANIDGPRNYRIDDGFELVVSQPGIVDGTVKWMLKWPGHERTGTIFVS